MIRVVDAFAENAFAAMGANEIEWLRRTRLTTYTGRLLAPSWLVLVGGPLRDFSLSADGSVDVRFPDCGEPVIEGIECTDAANIIEPGDILVVSPEGPPNDVLRSLITTDRARVDSFAASHQITQWSLTDSLSTPLEIQENVLLRLSTLQLMDGYIRFFDEMYGTRAKGVPVAIRPGFVTPIGGFFCVPDDRPACQTIEDEVHAAEGRMVESWREDGFDPWISYFLRYDESGNGLPLSDQAPAIAHFDGIVLDVNTNASPPGTPALIAEALPNAIAGVAQEIGSMPVIVSPWAGPMDFYTVGGFCEGEICLSAFEELDDLREDEIRVKMGASGVCHSDYSIIDGTIPVEYPIVLGHEGAGVVEEVGQHVTTLKTGDHVVLTYIPQCGKCFYCTTGKSNLCETTSFTRTGALPNGHRPMKRGGEPIKQMAGIGTMSEYSIVHETSAIAIDPEIPLEKAALVGCGVMTGVGAVINTAQVQPGSSVAVFGTGGIGLNVIQGSAMSASNTIIAVDTNPLKLEFALRFGATHTVDASEEDPVERIREITDGRGADYTFEAIGNAKVMQQAFESARKAGTVTVIGIAKADDELAIPASMLVRDEKRVLGSFYGSTRQRVDLPRLLGLYQSGNLNLDELITQRYSIDDAQAAFDDLVAGKNARGVLVFD